MEKYQKTEPTTATSNEPPHAIPTPPSFETQTTTLLEDILSALKQLHEDNQAKLEIMSKYTATAKSAVAKPSKPQSDKRTIDDVRKAFPQDLAGMITFEESGNNIIIKPRHYLGSDYFARIAAIIRDQLGGQYISAGRDSHFKVPR